VTISPIARKTPRRILALAATACALGLTAGACATLAPYTPAAAPPVATMGTSAPSSAATGTSTAKATASSTVTAPVVKVSPAAKAETAQLGVQVYWHTTGTAADVRAAADKVLNYVVSLGANTVGLTFPFYTNGVHPTRVYGLASSTPDPAALAVVIDEARLRGLRVMLRPVLDETNITDSNGDWRGTIQPPSPASWFTSYRTFLKPYLQLAQQKQVQYFVVGTELESLARQKTQWAALGTAAAKIYSGELDYSQNWDNWADGVSSTQAGNIGVDAYPVLHEGDGASVGQLTTAWEHWLRNRSSVLAKTVIQEVGIPAVSGAYSAPARWSKPGDKLDVPIQTKWFTAACASARALGLPGVYFWDVDSYADPAKASTDGSGSFIGRGDQAIKACFAENWNR
jgi:hypothetical protein